MELTLRVNGLDLDLEVPAGASLLAALRSAGFFGVKHGCETGECGACTVLLDGKPVNSCVMLAAQAEGHTLETIEGIGEHPEQGWKTTAGLHPLQQAFVETGAIQCGYCTPAQVLAAKQLLDRNPNPSEAEVRTALSGVLCRCTGYLKPVQAVLRAAAVLRGEATEPITGLGAPEPIVFPPDWFPEKGGDISTGEVLPGLPGMVPQVLPRTQVMPRVQVSPETQAWHTVGRPEKKVDAVKLVQGKPAFTADIEPRGMLYAKVLHSPHAHARIKNIDASQALALPGVAAVLTWQDIPRVVYSTAGQSDPIPGPLDAFSLDRKVRFVGDRVAFVAAESMEIAEQALKLIEVEYELLPALLDPETAMQPAAPRLHDEPEYVNFADSDPSINLAAHIRIDIGDVEKGFAEADQIFTGEYDVPKVQQAHIEPHVVITYWDEDDRLVIRTSTQVPFHVRRQPRPGARAADQAHPGHQTAHWRRLWRKTGSTDRRRGCSPDDCHRSTGDLRVHPRGRIHRRPLAPPHAPAHENRRKAGWHDHRQCDGGADAIPAPMAAMPSPSPAIPVTKRWRCMSAMDPTGKRPISASMPISSTPTIRPPGLSGDTVYRRGTGRSSATWRRSPAAWGWIRSNFA